MIPAETKQWSHDDHRPVSYSSSADATSRSRAAKSALIVVRARTLFEHVPAELDAYQASLLWKSLLTLCSEFVARTDIDGHNVEIWTVPTVDGA